MTSDQGNPSGSTPEGTPQEVLALLQGAFQAKSELDMILTAYSPVTAAEARSIITNSFKFHNHELEPAEVDMLLAEYTAIGAVD